MINCNLMPVTFRALPNGAVLYHIHNQSSLTRIQVVMRTGSIHEEEFAGCGLSHFLEHMLFGGCSRYPGESAADTIHKLGGKCNAYTTFDHTAYYAEVPVGEFDKAADVLTCMITEPLFPQEKFDSEKVVIAREADMIFDRPTHLLIQNLWSGIFPGHPARFPIIGYPDKIAGVTRDMMVEYYRRRYGAMRSYWIVTGNLETDHIQEVLSERLSSFDRGNLNEPVLPQCDTPVFAQSFTAEFADPVTRIIYGIKAPGSASGKQNPALDLLAGILGGSDSSRLPAELICKENLALSADAEFDSMAFGSVLGISAACEPSKQAKLEKRIGAILEQVRTRGVTAAELKREKLQQELTMYQLLKNTSSTVSMVNTMIMNYNTPDVTLYLDKLKKVTLDEINQAAFEYLNKDFIVKSVVVPKTGKTVVKSKKTDSGSNKLDTGVLSNGAKYAVLERNNIPIDTISLVLPAGPVWENGYSKGITQMLCKVLSSGPECMKEEKFYAFLDNHGIDLDVSSGNNSMAIELNFPPKARKYAEDIFLKILTDMRLEKSVFERIQNNLAEQLASRCLKPDFAGGVAAKRLIFGNHAAGNSRLESVNEIKKITRQELVEFFDSRLSSKWAVFGATYAPGDTAQSVKYQSFFEKAVQTVKWSDKELHSPQPAAKEYLAALKNTAVHNIELPRGQNSVICGVAGGFAHTREYYALLIMDAALNGLSSHLFKEVREKRSLAYSTGVWVQCGLVQGFTALHAGVKPENAIQALECLNSELDRLINNGLEAEEFESAKLAALSAYSKQMESVDAKLFHVQLAMFYGDDPQKSLCDDEKLRAMQLDECNKLLRETLTRSPRVMVNAGKILS